MPIICVVMNSNEMSSESLASLRRKMLSLVRAKSCKRCGGDLSIECDVYGVYIECIQCGATWSQKDLNLTAASGGEPVKASPTRVESPDILV
jgi:hypothetical protein